MQKNPYKAYSQATHTVAKTRQVVMLYDGVIRNLQQACEAMKSEQIEERYKKLVRASEIVIGLQSCLDFENGESTARILYDFYSSVDSRLLMLHRTNDVNVCSDIIAELKEVRDMWDKIDRGEVQSSEQATAPATTAPVMVPPSPPVLPYAATNAAEHRAYGSDAASTIPGMMPSKAFDV